VCRIEACAEEQSTGRYGAAGWKHTPRSNPRDVMVQQGGSIRRGAIHGTSWCSRVEAYTEEQSTGRHGAGVSMHERTCG
jgi:hypothetical protein